MTESLLAPLVRMLAAQRLWRPYRATRRRDADRGPSGRRRTVYRCEAAANARAAWVLDRPAATLYRDDGGIFGVTARKGVFGDARYVERFDTLGGVAPSATDCGAQNVGQTRAVHYSTIRQRSC